MSRSKKFVSCNFFSFPKYDSTIFITTLSDSLCVAGLASSLPRYGMAFGIYLNSTSAASQNLIPNLSDFLVICCINMQQAVVENNCFVHRNIFFWFVANNGVFNELIPDGRN